MNSCILNNSTKRLTLLKECVAHSNGDSIYNVKVIPRGQRPKKVQNLSFRAITVLRKA